MAKAQARTAQDMAPPFGPRAVVVDERKYRMMQLH